MTRRKFNKTLKACTVRGLIDASKLAALSDETREMMLRYVVRHRGPLLIGLVNSNTDMAWLAACGYLHQTVSKNSGMTFIHTSEHNIK